MHKLFENSVLFLFRKGKKPLRIPEKGRKVRITWLPSCRNGEGTPNPYIGMEGTVTDLKQDGSFHLFTGDSWLCGVNEYKFEYIDDEK